MVRRSGWGEEAAKLLEVGEPGTGGASKMIPEWFQKIYTAKGSEKKKKLTRQNHQEAMYINSAGDKESNFLDEALNTTADGETNQTQSSGPARYL